jgi:hypothetical protein
MARRRDVFQLTNDELSILCWLRISNGQAILSASAVAENSLFVVPDRLLQDGYVRTQMLSPTTMHYTLTENGREILEICESRAYFAAVAKRKSSRANTPDLAIR